MAQTSKRQKTGNNLVREEGALSELARLNRVLRTLSAGHRLLLRCGDELQLLQGMCEVVVDQGEYRYASVWYACDDERRTLLNRAYALGLPHTPQESEFFESLGLSWASPEEGGATAITVITGAPCIGRNLLTDPDHKAWREDAIRLDYGSLSAFPIRVDSTVIGALSIAASEPGAFDASEVSLLEELAEDLAYGIENIRIRTKSRQAEEVIRRMAFYDPLTDLPNRQLFCQKAQATIDGFKGKHHSFAILLIKVRQLHEINETFGFQQGDRFLMETTARLRETIGTCGEIARVGEAEFAFLLPNADVDSATVFTQRLIAQLQGQNASSGLSQYTRLTAGISVFPGHGLSPDLLVRHARSAMSEAIRSGRDYAIYSTRLDESCSRRLALTTALRAAINTGQLMLYCQPKIRLEGSALCGAEALVRWRQPTGEMVPAGEFVALAEFTGLITQLTYWVLEAAFRERFMWSELGIDLPLSVNLSAQDLRDPRLVNKIEGLMATWGGIPSWFQFEVTESAFMEDAPIAMDTLNRLKGMGFQLAVDDFGVGYSSLSYLHNLPVDTIKIDQSFVKVMLEEPEAAAIVHSTIGLAHQLNLEVVAEGVECQAIRERLAGMGCDVIQGYYVSAPMPMGEFNDWLGASGWKLC